MQLDNHKNAIPLKLGRENFVSFSGFFYELKWSNKNM